MQRIADVEAINIDLEVRLEVQAREYIELESDAAESLARWKTQYEVLMEEAANWKRLHVQQELKNHKIRDQLLRTERELHGILQKKYDIMEFARREERDRMRSEHPVISGAQALNLPVSARIGDSNTSHADRFPRKRIEESNHNPLGAPPQDVRRGRAVLALTDFFGFTWDIDYPALPDFCTPPRSSRDVQLPELRNDDGSSRGLGSWLRAPEPSASQVRFEWGSISPV